MTHFRPISEKEHALGNAGHDVPDYCAHCGKPFMEHHNGACDPIERHLTERNRRDTLARAGIKTPVGRIVYNLPLKKRKD